MGKALPNDLLPFGRDDFSMSSSALEEEKDTLIEEEGL